MHQSEVGTGAALNHNPIVGIGNRIAAYRITEPRYASTGRFTAAVSFFERPGVSHIWSHFLQNPKYSAIFTLAC